MAHKTEILIVAVLSIFVMVLLFGVAQMASIGFRRTPRRFDSPTVSATMLKAKADRGKIHQWLQEHPEIVGLTRILRTMMDLSKRGKFPSSRAQARTALPIFRKTATAASLSKEEYQNHADALWKLLTSEQRSAISSGAPTAQDIPDPAFRSPQPFRSGRIAAELKELAKRTEQAATVK